MVNTGSSKVTSQDLVIHSLPIGSMSQIFESLLISIPPYVLHHRALQYRPHTPKKEELVDQFAPNVHILRNYNLRLKGKN